ncbi:MAG: hypothetical protein O3A02_00735 [bacterium]|nr:hypothetical protein [bacterium]
MQQALFGFNLASVFAPNHRGMLLIQPDDDDFAQAGAHRQLPAQVDPRRRGRGAHEPQPPLAALLSDLDAEGEQHEAQDAERAEAGHHHRRNESALGQRPARVGRPEHEEHHHGDRHHPDHEVGSAQAGGELGARLREP